MSVSIGDRDGEFTYDSDGEWIVVLLWLAVQLCYGTMYRTHLDSMILIVAREVQQLSSILFHHRVHFLTVL
jgi:hypothetical protein